MSCCGSQRASLRQTSTAPASSTAVHTRVQADVSFEYSGNGQLTVTGPLTGQVYRFTPTAARLRVHGSDAPSLVSVPGLKPIR